MKKKVEIGYEDEFLNYIYLNREKYFNFRVVAFDVYFKTCIKSIDILGVDDNYYYIIEIKRDKVTEGDYNNLDCIMKYNKYDKPFKGILIGTREDEKVEKLCYKNKNIKCIIIEEVVYSQYSSNKSYWVFNKRENETVEGKLLKEMFRCTNGINIAKYNITSDEINIEFNECLGMEVCFRIRCSLGYIHTQMSVFKRHPVFYERWIEFSDMNNNRDYIDEFLFINNNYYKILKMKHRYIYWDIIDIKYKEIYNIIYELSNYINLNQLKFNEKNDFLITETEFLGIYIKNVSVNKFIIMPKIYKYFEEKNGDKFEDVDDILKYNFFYSIECQYIFIGNKLFKPSLKVNISEKYINIELTVVLKNDKVIKKEYPFRNKNNNIHKVKCENEFYLICNIYIILDFEDHVKSEMNNENSDISLEYYDSLISYWYKYTLNKDNNKIKHEEKKKYLALRDMLIKMDDEMKSFYNEIMETEFAEARKEIRRKLITSK